MRSAQVSINFNGRETPAILIEGYAIMRRRKRVGSKEYSWEEAYIKIYIPAAFRKYRKFLLIPIE